MRAFRRLSVGLRSNALTALRMPRRLSTRTRTPTAATTTTTTTTAAVAGVQTVRGMMPRRALTTSASAATQPSSFVASHADTTTTTTAASGTTVDAQHQPQASSVTPLTGRKFTHTTSGALAVAKEQATNPLPHESRAASRPSIETNGDYMLPHPIWSADYLSGIQQTHQTPQSFSDRLALALIRAMRFNFDWMSGYSFAKRKTEKMWLGRILFLESVAGVPGSIGATIRHLASLRRMRRDHGWIHTLLEEGENERMHLLTAIELRSPGPLFRAAILLTQGVFFNFYFCAYLVSPSFCHRVVGYLEEEAVKTYTTLLESIDKGEVWRGAPAPKIARDYWRLPETATMRDVIANIRADETHHRDVNHKLSDIGITGINPFPPGH